MTKWVPPEYHIEADTFASALAQISATRADALAVAVLAESEASIDFAESDSGDFGPSCSYFTLRLTVEPALYGRLSDDREDLCDRLSSLTREVSRSHNEYSIVRSVVLRPAMRETKGWKVGAKAWLRGEGINNQGRVRSDNIAAKQHDGLLFRSEPEVLLYDALKGKGVYLAPLPVFLRGGTTYQRLEPDFVLLHKGVVMVVEIDGATVHRESAAEAHARTQGLQHAGVHIERVPASACATKSDAEQCAQRLIAALEGYRQLRV
jgi:hypothetical protein